MIKNQWKVETLGAAWQWNGEQKVQVDHILNSHENQAKGGALKAEETEARENNWSLEQVLYCRADAVAMLKYSNRVVILPVCGSWQSVKVKYLLMRE